MKSLFLFLCLIVFSSVHAQSVQQEDINPTLDIKYDFDATKIKDKLIKSGITVSHNYSQYDALGHSNLKPINIFKHSNKDIEFSITKKYYSMLNVKGNNGKTRMVPNHNGETESIGSSKSRMAFLTAIAVGAVGGYYSNESLCNYRNEVDARIERLRNK
ncbi:MAG: hypothetical protein ACKVHQ_04190 [Gammaproteobacteria bacterium]